MKLKKFLKLYKNTDAKLKSRDIWIDMIIVIIKALTSGAHQSYRDNIWLPLNSPFKFCRLCSRLFIISLSESFWWRSADRFGAVGVVVEPWHRAVLPRHLVTLTTWPVPLTGCGHVTLSPLHASLSNAPPHVIQVTAFLDVHVHRFFHHTFALKTYEGVVSRCYLA